MTASPAGRRNVAVATAGICAFINLYATQAILPVLAGALRAPPGRVGLTVTAPLLAVALVAPLVGSISDRLGRRRLIVGAASLLAVPTALAGFSGGLGALLLCRFSQGLLLPFIFTVTVAYIGDECPGAEGLRLTGTYAVGTIFGGFMGRFVSGWATDLGGWRAAFWTLAGLTACLALVIALTLPEERRFRPSAGLRDTLGGFAAHLRDPRLLGTDAVGFAVLFTVVCVFTYGNFQLAAAPYRLGPAALGSVFAVYLAGMASSPVGARLGARFGRRPVLALAALLAAAGLLLTLAPALWLFIAGLAMTAAGVFVEQTLSLGFIGVAARRAKSTAVGLYVTAYYVGGSLGGIVPAGAWHRFGWPGCVALALAVQAVMLVTALATWREP